jgi:prevent-host-death family protein
MLDITKDIQSLTTFRRRSGDFMKQLKRSKRPVVLTVKGKAQAVVQDAEAYQRLLDLAARADVHEAIRQGLDDVAHGRTRPARDVFNEIRSRLTYLVELTDRGARDLNSLFVEKRAEESIAADRWYHRLEAAVYALESHPDRCPLAPEGEKARRPQRHLLYGKKLHVYRVVCEIDEQKRIVRVLTIRHAAMQPARLLNAA